MRHVERARQRDAAASGRCRVSDPEMDAFERNLHSPWLVAGIDYPEPRWLCAVIKAVSWVVDRGIGEKNGWWLLWRFLPGVHEWCFDVWRFAICNPHMAAHMAAWVPASRRDGAA